MVKRESWNHGRQAKQVQFRTNLRLHKQGDVLVRTSQKEIRLDQRRS